jgi:uroporphyrin-III C-methyltransferase
MNTFKTPRITLVGAGPGDPELITVKGIKALETADVVLYDALVNPVLLEKAPPAALRVFVGKRRGQKEFTQDQINALIVDSAHQHGHVVRLKGGDPFVFGRGMEEIHFAESFNIATEVVPGISSSISVPALAGISVTHRGVSNSFWVLTGTLSDGSLNPEIANAARSAATVVVLMGLHKLQEITAVYRKAGRAQEAAAVISKGSWAEQQIVSGSIDSIVAKTAEANIAAPAVIVIGPVVDLNAEKLQTDAYRADVLLNQIKAETGLWAPSSKSE